MFFSEFEDAMCGTNHNLGCAMFEGGPGASRFGTLVHEMNHEMHEMNLDLRNPCDKVFDGFCFTKELHIQVELKSKNLDVP